MKSNLKKKFKLSKVRVANFNVISQIKGGANSNQCGTSKFDPKCPQITNTNTGNSNEPDLCDLSKNQDC